MEPKPRGITTERTRIGMLPWVQHAAAEYRPLVFEPQGKQLQTFETNITRGRELLNLIQGSQTQLDHPPSVLLGGLGLANYELLCSLTPQKIAARLQKLGQFELTLVDNNPAVINDVRTRRVLYRTNQFLRPQLADEWKSYLENTGQADRIITTPQTDLIFHNGITDETKTDLFTKGIHAAAVPKEFRAALRNGSIKLLNQDMAWAYLGGSQPFDYVSLQNILMYADIYGQQMMVANAAAHTRVGGYMLLNDPLVGTLNITFSHKGGWLTDEKLHDLHLEKVDPPDGVTDPDNMLLKKY